MSDTVKVILIVAFGFCLCLINSYFGAQSKVFIVYSVYFHLKNKASSMYKKKQKTNKIKWQAAERRKESCILIK